MPEVQSNYESGKYLSIKAGKIRQRVAEGTPNAVLRKYTNPKTGQEGEVWEIVYQGWRGIVRDIQFYEGDGYENLNVVFDDITLSMSADSRYASDFIKKFAGADVQSEITITPYDFVTDDGKKKIGLSILQNEQKLQDHFSFKNDKGEWEQRENFPKYEGEGKEDWKIYLLQVKKFLKNWVLLHPINNIAVGSENSPDDYKFMEEEKVDDMLTQSPF